MKYFINALKKYGNFSGRASRSEYWYFVLFTVLFAIAATFIDTLILNNLLMSDDTDWPFGIMYTIIVIGTLIPGLAVLVRRLHDTGKSGWYVFIVLIPFGSIWMLILLVTDSQVGINIYGPNPNDIGNYDEIDQIGSEMVH